MYNWQQADWPNFTYDNRAVAGVSGAYKAVVTGLISEVGQLPDTDLSEYLLTVAVEEAVTSSSIEGENINREELRSSILNNLNLGVQRPTRDRRATAIARLITLNRQTFAEPLTETALKYWHQLLLSFDPHLNVLGDYRQGSQPMRIVSGPVYRQTVHFEAPPADRVSTEMAALISFCNQPTSNYQSAVARAGVAHLWFESIHPFEDGNGRLGRALIEKLLSQQLGTFVPFSLSHSIEQHRSAYYAALQTSQHTLDITPWMTYFCEVLLHAVEYAQVLIGYSIRKYAYFQRFDAHLTPSARKAISKMFAAGPEGFKGDMTARKFASINRVSRATATRALQQLTALGALTQHGAGRSTHYRLPEELPLP